METHLTVINDDQFDSVIKNSGLEMQEGEQIKRSYQPFLVQIAEIHDQSKKINWESPTELDESIARNLRLRTVKIRTDSEKLKDARKRTYLLRGNLEQACYNMIAATCKVAEDDFIKIEKAREIAEEKRRKQLHDTRISELQQYGFVHEAGINLGVMDETTYQAILSGLKKVQEDKIAEEKRIESERIAKEKADAEERARMIAENERLRKESEIKEKALAAEREKVDRERKAAEEEVRKEREAAEKKLAEERRIAAEKIAKEKAEAKRLSRELQDRRDADMKARTEELERIEAERIAQEKAKQKAEAEPDKEKLLALISTLTIPSRIYKTDAAMRVDAEIRAKFQSFKNWSYQLIGTL